MIGWTDIEESNGLNKLRALIINKYGNVPANKWGHCYDIVSMYFNTWDNRVAPQVNNDLQYTPVLFVWYAKDMLGVESFIPLQIMRAIHAALKDEL